MMQRVLLGLGLTLAAPAAGLGVAQTVASAATNHVKPTLTATQASFAIPARSSGTWIMNLWTHPAPALLVGRTTGTSGTLTIPVPQTPTCDFQVDVRHAPAGSTKSTFYSGLIATVPGCGQMGHAPRLTPGFWKTHPAATSPLLPQTLGSYEVSTAAQATAVLQAMRCNDAANCVAGHLLAVKLDVASGSSMCISGVIFRADRFLMGVNYHGPDSYTMTATQRATGLSLADALDKYTNDASGTSC
ncbi:MAG: hypothetical protein J2P57_15775 [Acidimicrobiaceae bacterium]|nr:hypothetical protein [Acidimicrobiaceae bacterium]